MVLQRKMAEYVCHTRVLLVFELKLLQVIVEKANHGEIMRKSLAYALYVVAGNLTLRESDEVLLRG